MSNSGLRAHRDKIFISYRRDDARGASGRVWDWLRIAFGRDRLFRDVAEIGAGRWRNKIEQALASSTACVAVIGRRWADSTNLPRLLDSNDVVRHELESALAFGDRDELTVIPLLVEDIQLAQLPTSKLPSSLQPLLSDWNVLALTESGWDDDSRRLIQAISESTGLPVNPELEVWLALLAGARRGLKMAYSATPVVADAPETEVQLLDGLLHRAASAEPPERPDLQMALEALATGNTLLAEASFEHELQFSRQQRQTAEQSLIQERRREGEAASHIANLALLRGDLSKAIHYFQMALEAMPDNHDAALELGYAWISRGELDKAYDRFQWVITQTQSLNYNRDHARAWRGLGDVLMLRGEGPNAADAYHKALALALELVRLDSTNPQLQRDLAISHNRIGATFLTQGNSESALAAYQAALAIQEFLRKQIGSTSQVLRDLSVGQEKIAAVLTSRGDNVEALAALQYCQSLRTQLLNQEPDNTQAQRDLSVIHENIGDAFHSRGEIDNALTAYRTSLELRQLLTCRDPENRQWQRDLSVIQEHVGSILFEKGERDDAFAFLQASLSIREKLLCHDPSNTQLKRDCFVSHIKLGEISLATGDDDRAGIYFHAAEVIAKELVQHNPTNAQWKRDWFVSTIKLADLHLAQACDQQALVYCEASLAIAEELVQTDPMNQQWQLDLVMACARLGNLGSYLSPEMMRHVLQRGRHTLQILRDREQSSHQQSWLDWFDDAIAALDHRNA